MTGSSSNWGLRELTSLARDGAIARNWRQTWDELRADNELNRLCRLFLSSEGDFLEAACGPGGGNIPLLLRLKPELRLIINDVEPMLPALWKDFLDRMLPGNGLSCAAFDICAPALKPGSLAGVSSGGGLGTISGDPVAALASCAVMLRPGGLLLARELTMSVRCLASLSQGYRQAAVYHPWLYRDYRRLLAAAGFEITHEHFTARRILDPAQSALAGDAAAFKDEIEIEWAVLLAKRLPAADERGGPDNV